VNQFLVNFVVIKSGKSRTCLQACGMLIMEVKKFFWTSNKCKEDLFELNVL
jgi:hypothetical protein